MPENLKTTKSRLHEDKTATMSAVRALYRSNRAAKAILDALASPQENAVNRPDGWFVENTAVEDVVSATDFGREAVVATLRKFAAQGWGRFLTGRRGQKTRLKWRIPDPVAFAKEVIGTTAGPAGGDASCSVETAFVEQPIWLRPGVQVTIRFPQNMTKEEAEKVAGVARNLWFGSSMAGE